MGIKLKRLTRDDFVQQTCRLLNERGRTDFTLSDVLDSCGAKKGSLYHFFPRGKNELVVAAVNQMAGCAVAHLESCFEAEASVGDAVAKHASDLSRLVEKPGQPMAIPFSAIAAITGDDNEEVTLACQQALHRLESVFLKQLKQDGLKASDAKKLATFIISSIEGAFLVSRVRRSGQPLRQAGPNLQFLVATTIESERTSHR
ncbi:putative HTH-type transcriptional regulator YxaF [Stieleria bergensis]|uniref:Putative HTH-type transcriptional regulator YxaF n=1 Tax=Stieleria bergensis TaxID=2528025 RepID=A0A517SWN2_9BACT|nr:putative HTH-type transcriptional regulator YxaF [Planctomycetes bacterium SV_7m_r]